tara:strand:+ start:7605 stop:7880 length:276 start_codon:yes stop_codon:yes gene_type:complete
MTTRADVPIEAAGLIEGDRNQEYGDPREMHQRAADIYNAYRGAMLTAHDVAMLLLSVKLARLAHMPDHRDSYVDICGYAGIAYEIASGSTT